MNSKVKGVILGGIQVKNENVIIIAEKMFNEIVHFGGFSEETNQYLEDYNMKNCFSCKLDFSSCFQSSSLNDHWCSNKTIDFRFDMGQEENNAVNGLKMNEQGSAADFPTVIKMPTAIDSKRHVRRPSVRPFYKITKIPVEIDTKIHIPRSSASPFYEMNEIPRIANDSKTSEEKSFEDFPNNMPIGEQKSHRRQSRYAHTCTFPTSLSTASVNCRVYPSSVKCIQRCAFGYTLDGGIRQDMQCKFKENKWLPTGFKECQPFVDCTLSLTSGGSTNCSSMSLTKAPECKIECLHYEDKPAVPEEIYSCDIDGSWYPTLPFCVLPKSGLVLVEAPKIKEHDDTDVNFR